MKRYIASDFAPSNAGLKNFVPFSDIKLEYGKVLDIYRLWFQANFTATVAGIFALLMGLKYIHLLRGSQTIISFQEEIDRRDWIATHHVRYTAPGESLTEEAEYDFVKPFTVWTSPTFIYGYTTAGDHDMNNVFCELHGEVRAASKKEYDQLQFEQKQEKRP